MEVPDAGGASSLSFHGNSHVTDKLFNGIVATLAALDIDQVDAVVCAGDLTDRCDPSALHQVWARLCNIADTLGAPLIATAGNHDYQRQGGEGPDQHLKSLAPAFPTRDDSEAMCYFAYHFARKEVEGTTFVTVDSAAKTGQIDENGTPEYAHGRVTRGTVDRISKSFSQDTPSGSKVLVVHHHPVQLPSIDQNESSRIQDAEPLLELLAEHGPWLIIHGHKHRPWIQYAPGGGGSAVLFSAGSLAAPLDGVLAQSTKNQFYLLELAQDAELRDLGLGSAGTFRAWTHTPIEPDVWVPAGKNDGLPAQGGFGWRIDPLRLAELISSQVRTHARDITWNELLESEPRVKYVIPDDWNKSIRHLSRIDASVKPVVTAEGTIDRVTFTREP